MNWLFPAILNAFSKALQDYVTKRSVGADLHPFLIAWSIMLLAVPFLAPLLWLHPLPELGPDFWPAVAASAMLNAIAISLYVHALHYSDLSLTVPLSAVSPLFMLGATPLMLGESVPPMGMVGVVLIVAGVWLINADNWREGFLAPWRALFHHKGPRLMLGVAFLWSISSNLDKIAVQNSSPLFYAFTIAWAIALAMTPAVLLFARRHLGQTLRRPLPLLAVGFLSAVGTFCHMTALTMAPAPYVVAVKRTSVLLSVLMGGVLLQEARPRQRFFGAAVMLSGVVVILFA
ncbi:MAG: EamA family transporter [Magnetococcales bacterium]|nr:EamA family transporter [Magnetococcales bacterium]